VTVPAGGAVGRHAGRALLAGMLGVFALPACYTTSLWRLQAEYRAESSAEAARVCVDARTGTLALDMKGTDLDWLRRLVPGLGDAAPWLLVEPQEHGATVAKLLEVIAARNEAGKQWPSLSIAFREPLPAGEDRCVIESWFGTSPDVDLDEVRSMPGVRRGQWSLYGASCFLRVAARVQALSAPPAGLQPWSGASIPIDQARQTYEPPGTAIRVLLTPPALALDVLLSPLELIGLPLWW